eukprot:COSAG02_NODE_12864_length_1480_cov_1.268646_3_plen_103_part_00
MVLEALLADGAREQVVLRIDARHVKLEQAITEGGVRGVLGTLLLDRDARGSGTCRTPEFNSLRDYITEISNRAATVRSALARAYVITDDDGTSRISKIGQAS